MKKNTKRKHRKHRSRPTIRFFSIKNNTVIWCQSFFEMFFALLLEFDDTVISYGSQVESIHSPVGRYTPDFFVQYNDETYIHFEIHHPSFLTFEYLEKFEAYQQYIIDCSNEPLIIVTELGVSEQVIKNLEELYYFKNEYDLDEILQQVDHFPMEVFFCDLMEKLGKFHKKSKQIIKAMLADRLYIFDLDQPLSSNPLLYRNFY